MKRIFLLCIFIFSLTSGMHKEELKLAEDKRPEATLKTSALLKHVNCLLLEYKDVKPALLLLKEVMPQESKSRGYHARFLEELPKGIESSARIALENANISPRDQKKQSTALQNLETIKKFLK
jgi:hypothetical protein